MADKHLQHLLFTSEQFQFSVVISSLRDSVNFVDKKNVDFHQWSFLWQIRNCDFVCVIGSDAWMHAV